MFRLLDLLGRLRPDVDEVLLRPVLDPLSSQSPRSPRGPATHAPPASEWLSYKNLYYCHCNMSYSVRVSCSARAHRETSSRHGFSSSIFVRSSIGSGFYDYAHRGHCLWWWSWSVLSIAFCRWKSYSSILDGPASQSRPRGRWGGSSKGHLPLHLGWTSPISTRAPTRGGRRRGPPATTAVGTRR